MAASTNGSLWRCAQEPLARLLTAPAAAASITGRLSACAASASGSSAHASNIQEASCSNTANTYQSAQPHSQATTGTPEPPCASAHFLHTHQSSGGLGQLPSHSWSPILNASMLQQTRGLKSKVTVEYHPMREAATDDYSSEPTNYVQLLGALSHAASMDRLQHLIAAYGDKFDGVHVAAALTRLPKLAVYKKEDLVPGVTSLPAGQPISKLTQRPPLPRTLPRAGARPAESYLTRARGMAMQLVTLMCMPSGAAVNLAARGPLGDPNLWRTAAMAKHLEKAAAAQGRKASDVFGPPPVTRYDARQVANTVWALGTLAAMGVELEWKKVAGALEGALSKLRAHKPGQRAGWAPRLAPADVAQLAKGLAQLGYTPRDKTLLPRLVKWTVANAGRFNARDVQMALHSFVALGYSQPQLVDALCTRAVALAKDFPPAGIAAVVRSIATATPTPTLPLVLSNEKSPRLQALRALAGGVAPQLVLLSPQDLATLGLALGRLGSAWDHAGNAAGELQPVPLPRWLSALTGLLCDKAARDLSRLHPTQLSAVLHMVAKLRLQPGGLLTAVAQGIVSEPTLDPHLNPMVGATVLQALAPLVRNPSAAAATDPDAVAAAVAAVGRVKGVYAAPGGLKHATPSGVASLCTALATLKDTDAQLATALAAQTRNLLSAHWDPRRTSTSTQPEKTPTAAADSPTAGGTTTTQAAAAPAALPRFTGEQLLGVLRGLRRLGSLSADDTQETGMMAAMYLERVLLPQRGAAGDGEEKQQKKQEEEEEVEEEGEQVSADVAIAVLQEVWESGARNTGAAAAVASHFTAASKPFLGIQGLTSTASGLMPRAQVMAQEAAACGLGSIAALLHICGQEGLLEGSTPRVLDAAAAQALAQLGADVNAVAQGGYAVDVGGAARLLRELAGYAAGVRPGEVEVVSAGGGSSRSKVVPRTLGDQVKAVKALQAVVAQHVGGLGAGDREVVKVAREMLVAADKAAGGQQLIEPAFDAAVGRV